jgi:hypothetical protein
MREGPYSILQLTYLSDDDGMTYQTLMFGYDTAAQAQKELPEVAQDCGAPPEECVVVRVILPEEASKFID